MRNWWIRSRDWYYRELRVDDLRSVQEFEENRHDAGVQRGGGALREVAGAAAYSGQQRMREILARLERRIRDVTARLERSYYSDGRHSACDEPATSAKAHGAPFIVGEPPHSGVHDRETG